MKMALSLIVFISLILLGSGLTRDEFMIFSDKHSKCVVALSAGQVQLATCNPSATSQKFRWVSDNRILSISLLLCLGAQGTGSRKKVQLFPCDEKSTLQKWECKNETADLSLKEQNLHLQVSSSFGTSLVVCGDLGCLNRWTIYGAASSPDFLTELFSIGGNAQGSPCRFPFKIGEKWYADCTTDGRSDGRLWCGTETDYNNEKLWGFCPLKVYDDWKKAPVTGDLNQLNPGALLTWHQARTSCLQQGSDLLSIAEPHEQSYITGLTQNLATLLWTGLNNLDSEGGWQWSDGSPFRYLRWAPGNPASEPGLNCASLDTGRGSTWQSNSCSKMLGYICHKTNRTSLPYSDPGLGEHSSCPSPWVPYAGNCYLLRRTKSVWRDALATCRKDGGDLASVHSAEEHSFVISQLGYMPTDNLWIGLNDQRIKMLFEWSDRSGVMFTKWQLGEPSHHAVLQEDCVLMGRKEGKWADDDCEKEYGFICKKKATSGPDGGTVVVSPGCKPGWTRHGSFCYYIGPETKTFEGAKQACQGSSSHLVDVSNQNENAFLISMVGLRPEKYFWIGLSNTAERHTFVWTNTNRVRFTHFTVGLPGKKQGCVAMTTGTSAGLWDVVNCTSREKYICKHLAEGVASTAAPATTPAPSCPDGWFPLLNRDLCFKVFLYNETQEKKSWFEARDYCKALGGNLLSIHSEVDSMLLSRVLGMSVAWIGLNSLDPNAGFVWSDGSSSSYENWHSGEPNNYMDLEFCTEVSWSMLWSDIHCETFNDWICQIHKGVTPNPPPTADQPLYNMTEDGWVEYNGYQYYINNELLSMNDARDFCKRRFGDLVDINDEHERVFLWKLMYLNSDWFSEAFYIGMMVGLDMSFQWMDGSPVIYVVWEENELEFTNYDANCVAMEIHFGFCKRKNCGSLLPSICKRSSDSPVNATVVPSVAPEGGCSQDWVAFQGKCYKLFGDSQQKSWEEARNHCVSLGGNLASIRHEKEQAFLISMMIDVTENTWIGLHVNDDLNHLWSDGNGLRFTNWMRGQPMVGYHWLSLHDSWKNVFRSWSCVQMVRKPGSNTGKWKINRCSASSGFFCKRNSDPQIPVPPSAMSPFSVYKLGNDSITVTTTRLSWDNAHRKCRAEKNSLISVLDSITQAFVELQVYQHNEPMWIGLNSYETDEHFQWVDKWPLHYSNWAPGEPKSNLACVFVDVDGKWKTGACNNTYGSMCKQSDILPTSLPQLPGTCPEPMEQAAWLPFRGQCYAFMNYRTRSWFEAVSTCLKIGGALASIEDSQEARFMNSHLEQNDRYDCWIGLYKNFKGDWLWIDENAVSYTNWDDGPQINHTENMAECVQMYPDTLKWKSVHCYKKNYFICKTAKVIQPTWATTTSRVDVTTTKSSENHRSKIILVPVILLIIIAAGFAAFVFYKRHIRGNASLENNLYLDQNTSEELVKNDVDSDQSILQKN